MCTIDYGFKKVFAIGGKDPKVAVIEYGRYIVLVISKKR
jgi:hypothetical protein